MRVYERSGLRYASRRASGVFVDLMKLLDTLNEQTLPLVLETSCWRGHSVYPQTKMSEERMVALLKLKPGGRLVIPLGPARGSQMLTLVEKGLEGQLRRTAVLPVIFSPLQGGERT